MAAFGEEQAGSCCRHIFYILSHAISDVKTEFLRVLHASLSTNLPDFCFRAWANLRMTITNSALLLYWHQSYMPDSLFD